jgi:cell division protease FtsH
MTIEFCQGDGHGHQQTEKQTWTIWYVVAAGLGALLLNQYWNISRQTDAISYSRFEQLVAGKKISAVVIDSDIIEGTLNTNGIRL